MPINHLLLIDIDGLRADVFQSALSAGELPNIGRFLGQAPFIQPTLSTAPSITFCAQASLFTGQHPKVHGIMGNQFFDRFGIYSEGVPEFFAFDGGDTFELSDAMLVFTDGLAATRLEASTLYERLAAKGKTAVVAGNMYAQGAKTWIKPSIVNLGRLLKGGKLLGMRPEQFDGDLVRRLAAHIQQHNLPAVSTLYLLGLDHTSHQNGPSAQRAYLVEHVDRLLGNLWEAIEAKGKSAETLVALFSDHGQIEVIKDDHHSIRIGFPFDQELTPFFTALGLDVHDFPGEAPNCDAVMALNGGSASVYLHNKKGKWRDAPSFSEVLRVGRAFWQAHETGDLAPDLKNALSAVFVRNVESNGWEAPFHALLPNGEMIPLVHWAAQQENGRFVDAPNRINNATGKLSGDIWLLSNYADGYYFGKELVGMHGGLSSEDSQATLAFGLPGASAKAWEEIKAAIGMAIAERCRQENGRLPNITDLVTGIETAVAHWL